MRVQTILRRPPGRATLPVILTAAVFSSSCLSGQQPVDLPAADRALDPRLEQVYRIGKIDGADWEIFGERPEVAFDGAGNLYVFDPAAHRVVVVGSGGRFVRQIGRRGDGPGELRSPMGFAVLRDGTVAVADMGHAAFLLFGPDGSFQRSVSFRGSGGLTVLGDLHVDPRGGSLYSVGRRITMMQAGAGGARPSQGTDRSIMRFGLGAEGTRQSVFTGWGPPPAQAPANPGNARRGPGGLGIRPLARAFEPELLAAVLPDGRLVVSDSTAYNLKLLSPDGRLERVLRRPFRPTPATPQIQRAERERRLADLAAGRGPQRQIAGQGGAGPGAAAPSQSQIQQVQRQQIEQLQFYPELSVVTGLRTGWTGKIWVERRASGRDVTAGGPVDVLTPSGEYLGTIAPGRTRIPDAFGPNGLAAWVERDRFDTPIVVVRRLPQALR